MKNIFLVLIIVISMTAEAQVSRVYLQASGLTCSMCSNSINKALKTLDFVERIEADIKHYTFEITFKPGSLVDFDKIRRKVEDAGFFVSRFQAAIDFDKLSTPMDRVVTIANQHLVLVSKNGQQLKGVQKVTLLDKGFVPSREFKARPFSVETGDLITYHVDL